MKKLFLSFLLLFIMVFLGCSACSNSTNLTDAITELRIDIFKGESESVSVSSAYGFNKLQSNGYFLTFKINNPVDMPVTYTVSFEHDKLYTETFTQNPVTNTLTASVQVDNFSKKEFSVDILYGSEKTTVTLKSIKPENTLDYKTALNSLKKSQPSLLNNYIKDGVFTANICMRLTVKENKPFYYVAFTDEDKNVKAFLLDGVTAKVLAVREIF
jgi:hypothetical protein